MHTCSFHIQQNECTHFQELNIKILVPAVVDDINLYTKGCFFLLVYTVCHFNQIIFLQVNKSNFVSIVQVNQNHVKSVTHGEKLLTVLFFATQAFKYFIRCVFIKYLSVVYPGQEGNFNGHEQLVIDQTYFVKNTKKKTTTGIPNLYEATHDTSIKLSKRSLKKTERF